MQKPVLDKIMEGKKHKKEDAIDFREVGLWLIPILYLPNFQQCSHDMMLPGAFPVMSKLWLKLHFVEEPRCVARLKALL